MHVSPDYIFSPTSPEKVKHQNISVKLQDLSAEYWCILDKYIQNFEDFDQLNKYVTIFIKKKT